MYSKELECCFIFYFAIAAVNRLISMAVSVLDPGEANAMQNITWQHGTVELFVCKYLVV